MSTINTTQTTTPAPIPAPAPAAAVVKKNKANAPLTPSSSTESLTSSSSKDSVTNEKASVTSQAESSISDKPPLDAPGKKTTSNSKAKQVLSKLNYILIQARNIACLIGAYVGMLPGMVITSVTSAYGYLKSKVVTDPVTKELKKFPQTDLFAGETPKSPTEELKKFPQYDVFSDLKPTAPAKSKKKDGDAIEKFDLEG